MDTLEYRNLMEKLDRQLEGAKKEAAGKARLEEFERKLKLVDHWIQGLEAKKAEFAQYGAAPDVDLDREIEKLREERFKIEAEMAGGPAPMPDGARIELETLMAEIQETPDEKATHEERWAAYEIWSLKWRILVNRVGQSVVDRERVFAKAFALIRERMNAEKIQGPFIRALNPKLDGDWPILLADAERRLRELAEKKGGQDAAEDSIFHLMGVLKQYHLPEDQEGVRKLRHAVRSGARFQHVRDEIAELVHSQRALLEPEFSYLWKVDQEEPVSPQKKLTRRDIVQRILRRMKSKALIGACHGPYDRIVEGFPGHDLGRSRAAVDLLIKTNVIRKKVSVIGSRISIEPKAVGIVEGFIKGEVMGIGEVDAWCQWLE